MSFLLDTDTCSAHLKGHAKVVQRCLQYTGRLYISVIGLGELYTCALRAKAPPKRLHHLLDFLATKETDARPRAGQSFS